MLKEQPEKPVMISSNELVTVIITTFNRIDYLKTCISSIIKQTCTNLEIIVISDGKDADAEALIEDFNDSRISYYELTHSGLPAIGRNFGISVANGSYFAFCDDDDCWMPNKIERQLYKVSNSSSAIVHCDTLLMNSSNEIIQREKNGVIIIANFIEKYISRFKFFIYTKNNVTLSSILVRASMLKDVRFAEQMHLRGSEDYYFILKAVHSCTLSYLDEKLVCYRKHDSNISNSRKDGYERSLIILRTLRQEHRIKLFFYFLGELVYNLKLLFLTLRVK